MRKHLLALILAAAGLVAVNETAAGLVMAVKPASARAVTADVVAIGKVTAIEKETVDALPHPGAKEKVAYKIAVVKVQTGLAGTNNITHVKIGFIPPAPQPAPQPVQPGVVRPGFRLRPGFQAPELKEGQEMLFFLVKHPSADFYMMPPMSAPIDVSTDQGKKELEAVKKVVELLADPMKGLKSDKADVRVDTAANLVTKYRSGSELGGDTEEIKIDAEESKLILKALVEADWKAIQKFGEPNAMQAFGILGLTEKDGWKPPMFPRRQPGQPPVDFIAIQKEAFVKWLDGPGKDYTIKKLVPKKK